MRNGMLVGTLAVLACAFALAGDDEAHPQAPAFSATDVNGKDFKLDDFKGKVVILDFWATWCPPCRAEIPAFVALDKTYRKDGLVIIGIALEQKLDAEPLKKWLKENKVEYTVALDTKKDIVPLYKEVPGTNGLQGIPTTLLIDRSGKVSQVLVGGHPKEAFETAIKPLLAEKAKKAEKK